MNLCRSMTTTVIALALLLVLAAGCNGETNGNAVDDKTFEDYKSEAEREITTENAESELEELERKFESESP